MTNASIMYILMQLLWEQLSLVVTQCLFHASTTSDHAQLSPEDAIILKFCVALTMWHHGIFVYTKLSGLALKLITKYWGKDVLQKVSPRALWQLLILKLKHRVSEVLQRDCSKLNFSHTSLQLTRPYNFHQKMLTLSTWYVSQWSKTGKFLPIRTGQRSDKISKLFLFLCYSIDIRKLILTFHLTTFAWQILWLYH